ncbi:MAG: 6-carboxytetrahydropterin synthase, partial [Lachnospiraceae bacterium]|nr:6-carboxytetrahydropterin synthase [Lachnospiraceae bacterium]
LKNLADNLDHSLIVEEGSLKEKTVEALREENFRMVFLPFRPTAENFAKYIYDELKKNCDEIYRVRVYETPGNYADYEA